MMDLAYNPTLSDGLVARLEEAARGFGLPLRQIELLGQDSVTAQGFVRSVRAGDTERYLQQVDFQRLEARLADRVPREGLDPVSTPKAEA